MAEFDIAKQIVHVFNAWGKTLVKDTKTAINKAIVADGGGQTSKLSGSVNYKVINQSGVISFQLTMNDYWKFVDKGVNGTQISHGSPYKFKGKNLNQKAMLNFINARHFKIELNTKTKGINKSIRNKGIRQGHKKLSIDQAKKTTAFLIGRSIAKKGINPLRFMDDVITQERLSELKDMLKPLIKEQIVFTINSDLNK